MTATTVATSGDVVLDLRAVRINYLKSWFFVDLLSCLPYDIFNALQQANSVEVASSSKQRFHYQDFCTDVPTYGGGDRQRYSTSSLVRTETADLSPVLNLTCNQSSRSAQPPTLSGMGNEHRID